MIFIGTLSRRKSAMANVKIKKKAPAKNFNYKIFEDINLSGFGKDVRSVVCKNTNQIKCYFNQEFQVYFPKPLNIIEINDIIIFLHDNGILLTMREVI